MQERLGLERVLDLPPVPAAAPRARAALRALLAEPSAPSALAARGDDALLALSELVTNAVLHGREPLRVVLALTAEVLRVEVSDGSSVSPGFSMLDPTAVTGRGLLIVSSSADAWGVEPGDGGKTVWFELRASGDGRQDEDDVDALLAAWADDLPQDPAEEQVRVVLTGLDVALTARAEAHVEGLLRELALLEAAGQAEDEEVRVARQVCAAAGAIEAVRGEVKRQLAAAVARGLEHVDVELRIQRCDAEAVRDFSRAVDEADRLSRNGLLLAEPAERPLSEARQAYMHRVLAQLSS